MTVQQIMASSFPQAPPYVNALTTMMLALTLDLASWYLIGKQAMRFKERIGIAIDRTHKVIDKAFKMEAK